MNPSDLKKWLATPRQSCTVRLEPSPRSPLSTWAEFAKTKTWLHKSSRPVDSSSTCSFANRDHQVADSVAKDNEKWLARPVVDSLSERLQSNLSVSTSNPWLARKRPSATSAILNSPTDMWLAKDRKSSTGTATSKSPWLYDPSRARHSQDNDPMRGWREQQKGLSYIKQSSPPIQRTTTTTSNRDDNQRWLAASTRTQEVDKWLVSHRSADQSVGGRGVQDEEDDVSMWLAGGYSTTATSKSTSVWQPLPTNTNPWLATPPAPKPVVEDMEKWLLPSATMDDQDSVASVATLGSDFEFVEEY